MLHITFMCSDYINMKLKERSVIAQVYSPFGKLQDWNDQLIVKIWEATRLE